MISQKLKQNIKLNSTKKAITALLLISMLFGMLQIPVLAADASLTKEGASRVCEIIGTDGVTIVESYDNFADALAAIQNGQTIRLLCDIEYNVGIKIINKSITFDVNGFRLNVINSSGHGLEVGADGELRLIGNDAGGQFNVKGNGKDKHGVYAHSGGKAEVSTAYAMMNWGEERGAYATGVGTVITVYGNVNSDTFYAIEAADGATLTVYGNALAGAGMIARGTGTTVTVYGNSGGGGTGVIASDHAVVYVKGNVIGGGAGIVVSTGAQVTVDGTVKATSGNKVYVQFDLGGGKYDNKMQEDHELTSSKTGYFEYTNGDSIVWVKDPVVYVVRHRETGNLYRSISEAIAAIKSNYGTFVLEVLGDVVEKDHIIINNEDVTIVSVDGNHVVTFASPAPSSGWKFALQGGGALTLGEGTTTNVLTVSMGVSVTDGEIKIQDGVKIISNTYAIRLSGSNAKGAINGGHLEGATGALNLEKGAKISEISGGVFYGKQEAVHLTDINTKIEKISGGNFYQTNPETTLHGQALFVQNEAQIGEISGGHFEAARSNALIVIRGGRVDEISGGKFVARNTYDTDGIRNAVIRIETRETYPKASIGTVSGGDFIGGHFGMLSIADRLLSIGSEIDKITGGTFEATIAFQNDVNCVVNEISGGTFLGSQGIFNVGTIGKIGGNVKIIGGTGSGSYGIFNYRDSDKVFGQIGEISGGQISSSGAQSIANAGTINLISGGTITSSASYGITNRGIINLISGGTIIGAQNAIYCYVTAADQVGTLGVLGTISNGVFWGKSGTAIILSSPLELEPDLVANTGLGRYQSGNGRIFNDDTLVVYPKDYFMSDLTVPVAGISGVEFRYLTLDDSAIYEFAIIYVLNGGDNAPGNPTTYDTRNLPLKIADPTRLGYEFWGWEVRYADGSAEPGLVRNYVIPVGTTGDITLIANGPPVLYSIKYNLNGGKHTQTPNTYSVMSTFPINIANPTKAGYEFLGWTITYANGITDTEVYSFQISEGTTGNIELTAHWSKAISYNIIYILNGGEHTQTPSSYTVEDLPVAIADPTRLGYEFWGWEVRYADGSAEPGLVRNYVIPVGTTGDITLTAKGHTVLYSIIYDLAGGEHSKTPDSYTILSSFPISVANPTKAGCEFLGWTVKYVDGTVFSGVQFYSVLEGTVGDIWLSAVWSETGDVRYWVVYEGNGYTGGVVPVDSNSPYVGGSQVTVLGQGTLSRSGYSFLGWATTPSAVTPTYTVGSTFTITADTTLYAIWKQNPITTTPPSATYTVSYQPGTHGTFATQTTKNLAYGDPTPTAPKPTGEVGWVFAGWSPVPSATVTGSRVYVAQWIEDQSVNLVVQFVDWDNTLLKSQMVPFGGNASAPKDPTREGYIFTGWDQDYINITTDLTITAQYVPDNAAPVTLSGWALVNLVLSLVGFVLALGLVIYVLLKRKQTQKKFSVVERSSKQNGQLRRVWLAAIFALGIAGIIVFLLTENLSLPMTFVDSWTILNVVIFAVQIIVTVLVFKCKKQSSSNKENLSLAA